ncbi:MAG: hypothetical protein ACQEWV_31440 [Bacillota bacterium]
MKRIDRAVLFSAAFSPLFESILKKRKNKDVPLHSASWLKDHHWLWLEQNPSKQEGGKVVNVNILREGEIERVIKSVAGPSGKQEQSDRCEQPIERREGKIPSERIIFRNQGGISIKIG